MNLRQAILNRRSVRRFRPDAVADEVFEEVLEAGTWAPSHNNTQPWEFVLIGPETRRRLAALYSDLMEAGPLQNPALSPERKKGIRQFVQDFGGAPLLFAVVCPPAQTDLDRYDFPLAAAAAIQNILLAAWEKELAGVWLSLGSNPRARAVLGVADASVVAGIVAMGYPQAVPPAQPRIPVADKLRHLP